MKFVPHPEYNHLLTQAFALARLNESLEAQIAHYRAKDYAHAESVINRLKAELESERQMNAILTNELNPVS
jgi:hypothetical protein